MGTLGAGLRKNATKAEEFKAKAERKLEKLLENGKLHSPKTEQEREEFGMAAAREVVLKELKRDFLTHTLTNAIGSDIKDENGTSRSLGWSPKSKMVYYARMYSGMLEDAKKANVPNPHGAALARMRAATPVSMIEDESSWIFEHAGNYSAARLTEAILRQDDSHQLTHLEKVMLDQAFPKGSRPLPRLLFL